MSDVLKVENEKILNSLQNHEDGEIAFLEDIKDSKESSELIEIAQEIEQKN